MMPTLETLPVSIVIPVFNCEEVLAETLESVRAQTFRDFEVIMVDDGSTDGSATVARRFCEKDSRFHLIQQANGGISAARNAGIEKARGEWIAFLDDDDIWFPEKLTRQMQLSREDPRANFLFTNYHTWDGRRDLHLAYAAKKPLPEGDTLKQLIFGFVYLPSTVTVRRQALLDAGLFDVTLKMAAEDWDMWLRLASRGIWARGMRESLVRHRRWPGSLTCKNPLPVHESTTRMLRENFAFVVGRHPDLEPDYHRSLVIARRVQEAMTARVMMDSNPDALARFMWGAWRRQRRLKWLRWYLFLKWPAWLGGNATRHHVREKIRAFWPLKFVNAIPET
jgi:glycosyltransferase involved in cell wall biosynthesis